MPTAWQTDLFIRIASCHENEYSTGGTIFKSFSVLCSAFNRFDYCSFIVRIL